jgi:hypothetical protein
MKEIWRDVPGYEGFYKASSFGKVCSVRSGRLLKGFIRKEGYLQVTLSVKGIKLKNDIQRIIYRTFKEPISTEDLIHHVDEDKLNNHINNLEKTNRSDHKKIHNSIGVDTRFKRKHFFDDKEIIALYENHSTTEISKMKGCDQKTVDRFIKRVAGSLYNHYRSSKVGSEGKVLLPFSET